MLNMTSSDRERLAYISGAPGSDTIARLFGDVADYEDGFSSLHEREEGLKSELKKEREEGYQEGLGADTAEIIAGLNQRLVAAEEQFMMLRKLMLTTAQEMAVGGMFKTVAERKAKASSLARTLDVNREFKGKA